MGTISDKMAYRNQNFMTNKKIHEEVEKNQKEIVEDKEEEIIDDGNEDVIVDDTVEDTPESP